MNKYKKRFLAILLTFAMIFTLFPATGANAAFEPEPIVVESLEIKNSKFVASGAQNSTDTWLIATTENGTNGTEKSAAFIKDETASEAKGGLGSTRVGAMAFSLPEKELTTPEEGKINPELIIGATVTIHVKSCNKDNMGSRKTKAGLFRVPVSYYDKLASDGINDSTATNLFPAVNNDYSKEATVFSKEWLSLSSAGTTTFDVTDWVKEAITKNEEYAIFRLQTVICGFDVTKNGENAPTLSIYTLTEQQAADQTKEDLTLPESTRGDLKLPTVGVCGSLITWESQNKAVIANDGTVTRQQEDVDVTLTATITRGKGRATKDITVTVKGTQSGPQAAYAFQDSDLTDKRIDDLSGNGFHAELKGKGATITDGMLMLPGGAAGSDAAYVSIPKEVFVGQDTLTINVWLKNQTGSNNYAAMFFGTKTKHVDSGSTANMPLNYWLLNPADKDNKGMFKSVWTNGDNTDAPYTTETAVSKTKTGSDWAMYTTVITPTSIKGYYNGKEVCSNTKEKTTSDFGSDLVAFIGRSSYNDMFYKGGVYGVTVYAEALTQAEVENEYYRDMPSGFVTEIFGKIKTNLTDSLGDLSEVREDLTLPTEGENQAEISWSSDKPEVISKDGKVTRPENQNAEVALTATIRLGGKTDTATFKATVISTSKQSQLDLQVKHLAIDGAVLVGNMELPSKLDANTKLTWTSSKEDVVKIEQAADKITAVITRPSKGEEDAAVTLTVKAVLENGSQILEATKDYAVKVRAESYGSLMAYTNSRESASLGNSLHLAYSENFTNYTALNSNTGICFANNEGGSKNSSPNGLQDMKFFLKADGTYGMIAKNVSNQKYIYVFDSEDLVHFTNERQLLLDSNVTELLEIAQYAYDGTNITYEIYWTDGTKNYRALTKDFKTVIEQGETTHAAGSDYTTDILPPEGAAINDIIGVSKSEYQRVVNKLDVVRNTGMQKVSVTAKAGDDLSKLLPEKVTADYSDGSTADMGVEWNAQDLAKVDLSKAGTYNVSGTVKQTQYPNPFIEQRADPCILKGNDGYYYFTASYPMRGDSDAEGYDRIVLRRSKTIAGLAEAEEIAIWDCDSSNTENRYVWAPEIRLVDGNYYVFYTSSIDNSVWTIRPHVLKCTNPEDIMNPSSWQAMGRMQSVASDGLAFTGFSLDMTVFENQGHWYVIWAQADGYSSLFLAEIDPKEPWKCISESVKISVPEYSWERQMENVDEGPSVIKNNGKIYVAFSASGTGPEYCVGLLSIDETADMFDKNAWVKQPYPVLTSSDVPGEYGPGHNSFTVDEDGNPIFVYHARGQQCYENKCEWSNSSSLGDPCRDARLKRVHWAADGTPILKMSYQEELAEENRTVTATIKVESGNSGDNEKPTPVKNITINKENVTLKPKEAVTLTAKIEPSTATNKKVIWNSKDQKVATVTQSGKVTAKAVGTTTITATTEDGGFTATCKVTVKIPVTKVTLNKTKLTLGAKEKFTLKATIAPKNATNKTVKWISSKKSVATVSSKGVVTAKKTGKVTITAKADGKTKKCTITVKKAPKKISLNAKKKTLKKGKKFQIKVKLPKNTASNKITYKTSNKKVAIVSASGKVTAKKKGKATITATTFNKKKATLKITVK